MRQVVGYDRYAGPATCDALQTLYVPLCLYLNFFQPVMVLDEKHWDGTKVTKRHNTAKTPYQRVLAATDVSEEAMARLRQLYPTLNLAALLRQVEARQQALWQLGVRSHTPAEVPNG